MTNKEALIAISVDPESYEVEEVKQRLEAALPLIKEKDELQYWDLWIRHGYPVPLVGVQIAYELGRRLESLKGKMQCDDSSPLEPVL